MYRESISVRADRQSGGIAASPRQLRVTRGQILLFHGMNQKQKSANNENEFVWFLKQSDMITSVKGTMNQAANPQFSVAQPMNQPVNSINCDHFAAENIRPRSPGCRSVTCH